jgi:hypothetical protein
MDKIAEALTKLVPVSHKSIYKRLSASRHVFGSVGAKPYPAAAGISPSMIRSALLTSFIVLSTRVMISGWLIYENTA